MTGYIQVNLNNMLRELGEDETKNILSSFICPQNKDVEYFLKNTAIEFSKQGLAKTHLVFASYKGKPVLVGYFTLAIKSFVLKKSALSKSARKKICKFGHYDLSLERYIISAPLIGQLGKNYSNGFNKLITGDELLKMALDKITIVQQQAGGKVVYLECEDKEKLINFYRSNGFVIFGKRTLDNDEIDNLSGKYLIQMLKYMGS